MTLTAAADAARHETPNAVMRTLAAPSTGSAELAVWEVTMRPGQRGPVHTVDREQVWLVLDGVAEIVEGDDAVRSRACAGDAVTIAGGLRRQIVAEDGFRAVVASRTAPSVTTPESNVARPLPWAI
jgi:quercetin dioxygenase-like cupin family protein